MKINPKLFFLGLASAFALTVGTPANAQVFSAADMASEIQEVEAFTEVVADMGVASTVFMAGMLLIKRFIFA